VIARQNISPAVIVGILSRAGPNNESLAGELIEEFRRGRSALWLSAQIVAAILTIGLREIRAHRLVALSGVVTGLALLWCFISIAALLLVRAGFPHAAHWHWWHVLLVCIVGFAHTGVSGWVVGRVHRSHRPAAVFSFAASVLIVSALELPLLYRFAPSVFFGTVVPLLPELIMIVIGAPVPILIGGLSDR
jgi:hypothetical protein